MIIHVYKYLDFSVVFERNWKKKKVVCKEFIFIYYETNNYLKNTMLYNKKLIYITYFLDFQFNTKIFIKTKKKEKIKK